MAKDNIGLMFRENTVAFKDRICMKSKKDGKWVDYLWKDVNTIVREFGLGLISLGIQEGDRISLLSENRAEWAFTDLAASSIRAAIATIYPTNTVEQVKYIVNDSASKFLVLSNKNQLDKYNKIKDEVPTLQKVIILDPPNKLDDKNVLSFDKVRELGRAYKNPEEFDKRLDHITPDDLLTLIYTSGTTGDPKGVMLTHRNLISNVKGALQIMPIKDGDTLLSFLPLSHSLERMAGHYSMLYKGITIAYAESIDKLVENMQEIKPNMMVAVPRIYEKMYARILENVEKGGAVKKVIFDWAIKVGSTVSKMKMEKKPLPFFLQMQYSIAFKLVFSKLLQRIGGNLKYFVSGGAPLAKELGEFFHAAGILILEGYGLTETSPVITVNTPYDFRFGTVGKPIPGVQVKIADDGEILAKGDNVMKGYFNKPEATKEVLSSDGWFATGDIGKIDEDGFLKITDRKKDLIVTSGGKNIAPQNIENMLKMNKYIEQACIIGDKRNFLVALLLPSAENLEKWAKEKGIIYKNMADLIANPEVKKIFQDIIDEANNGLAKYESIKKFSLLESEFSVENNMLTPTLKVKRKEVTKRYQKLIDEMYSE